MSPARKSLLWMTSILVVLGVHAGLFDWALFWRVEAPPVLLPPAAMMIELAPPAAPRPAPAPPAPPQVQPEPEPERRIVEAPRPRIEIPKPKPRPRPRPQPPKPRTEPPKPQQVSEASEASSESTQAAPAARPAETASAPVRAPVSGPSQAEISWQSRLLAHLARYRQYPDAARRMHQEGTVKLRFQVDGNGRVLSYEVVGSSGHRILDRATQQMIRRAQPLPKPPGELLRNGSVEVVAPIVYSLRHHR